MKIVKVFNNNAVAVITDENKEAVALGSGIGFGKKVEDIIDTTKVEKIYYIQDDLQTKFLELLKDTNLKYLELAEEVCNKANAVGIKMQHGSIVALADHISFALTRASNNITLPNLIVDELKVLYKTEFDLGLEMLDLIKDKTGILLPNDEAGYIALHIIQASGEITADATLKVVDFVKVSINLIEDVYQLKFKENDFYYLRLTTHLKFLALRVMNKEKQALDVDVEMLNFFFTSNKLHKVFAERFYEEILIKFNQKINKEEILFIIIHITKFLKK